jgi:osmotically-inducible protein OsmY
MPDRYTRNRNRPGQSESYRDRDDRSWRQQEQFSSGERGWNQGDHDEDYGQQMSDPYRRGGQSGYGSTWDRSQRSQSGGQGYSRREPGYSSSGEYNYGPAHYDTGSGRGFTSFSSEDQAGRDFNAPTGREYRGSGGGGHSGGYAGGARLDYDRGEHERGFLDRAGDEIASWFGDEEAAQRREMDHTGRGPSGYTRSDQRILEDACDHLTDDWAVDARNVQVTVKDGEITLDGTVPTRQQKRHAEDCVEDISGVRHVQNNLRVQEGSGWDRGGDSARAEGEQTPGSLA